MVKIHSGGPAVQVRTCWLGWYNVASSLCMQSVHWTSAVVDLLTAAYRTLRTAVSSSIFPKDRMI